VELVRERVQLHASIVSREDAAVKPDVWLVRHGETAWSASGRHTGRTDVELTDAGRAAARSLAPALAAHSFAVVRSSPVSRSRETARLAGFADAQLDDDLRELDYGDFEGLTTAEIRARGPEWRDWTVWTGELPGGESLSDAAERARRVLERADAADGGVLLFGHGHQLRILAAVALELAPAVGQRLMLDPAHVSILGREHDVRAIRVWNRVS
jgi:probable phosphoglycerate mutase